MSEAPGAVATSPRALRTLVGRYDPAVFESADGHACVRLAVTGGGASDTVLRLGGASLARAERDADPRCIDVAGDRRGRLQVEPEAARRRDPQPGADQKLNQRPVQVGAPVAVARDLVDAQLVALDVRRRRCSLRPSGKRFTAAATLLLSPRLRAKLGCPCQAGGAVGRGRRAPLLSDPVAFVAWDGRELSRGHDRTYPRPVPGVERACVAVGGWVPGG